MLKSDMVVGMAVDLTSDTDLSEALAAAIDQCAPNLNITSKFDELLGDTVTINLFENLCDTDLSLNDLKTESGHQADRAINAVLAVAPGTMITLKSILEAPTKTADLTGLGSAPMTAQKLVVHPVKAELEPAQA